MTDPDPIELPLDAALDLHTFRPKDVAEVVRAYLEACRAQGLLEVRVIHGKGIGTCNAPCTPCSRGIPMCSITRLPPRPLAEPAPPS